MKHLALNDSRAIEDLWETSSKHAEMGCLYLWMNVQNKKDIEKSESNKQLKRQEAKNKRRQRREEKGRTGEEVEKGVRK